MFVSLRVRVGVLCCGGGVARSWMRSVITSIIVVGVLGGSSIMHIVVEWWCALGLISIF